MAEIENQVEELKKQKEDLSDEILFKRMNQFIQENDDDQEMEAPKTPETPEQFKNAFEDDRRKSSSTPLCRLVLERNVSFRTQDKVFKYFFFKKFFQNFSNFSTKIF